MKGRQAAKQGVPHEGSTNQALFGSRFCAGPSWGCPGKGGAAGPAQARGKHSSLQGLRTQYWAASVLSHTYTVSSFSKLAVEGHLDFVLVSSPLIKGVAAVKGWAVQMQANGSLCVAYILHTVQANGVYSSEGMK